MTTDEDTTEDSTADREISQDETPESDDLQEQSSRLSTDRDDPPAAEDDEDDEDQGDDTFPRPYVERLRARSAGYRTRANTAEARATELERALFTERVRGLGVLADPSDLPYDPEALDDPDALRTAVDALVAKRPHLRRRGVSGAETGAREAPEGGESVSLLGLMRGSA